jgi:hypothetical protein
VTFVDCERWKGSGKKWVGGEVLGFYGGATGSFIEHGEVYLVIPPAAMAEMRRQL